MHANNRSTETLSQMVREAWAKGASIDLTGCAYGRIHWGNKTDVGTTIMPYYKTLAGFAATSSARTALEIGTHWGGSGLAILRGMMVNHARDARLITVDRSTESDNFIPHLAEAPQITKIVGDGNGLDTIEAIVKALDGKPLDFLYIDAMHTAEATLANFAHYVALLSPKLALFDDILLPGTNMARFWAILRAVYPDRTINCVDVIPDTRKPAPECGFGLWVCV